MSDQYFTESEEGVEGKHRYTIGFEDENFIVASLDRDSLEADNLVLDLRGVVKLHEYLSKFLKFYKLIEE